MSLIRSLKEAILEGEVTPEEAEELTSPEELERMEQLLRYQKRRAAEKFWREGRWYAREVYPPSEAVF